MNQPGRCIHFNGVSNACCEAGVNYKELAGPGDGWARRLPCYSGEYRFASGKPYEPASDAATCDKRQEPTPEQVADDERKASERFEATMKARAAIVAHLGGPWKKGAPGASGEIECPNCGGRLRFSRAGYNGHIHAACSTDNCVSWME